MKEHFAAIRHSLTVGNYWAALFLTLTLPSICGALESADGCDNRNKYKKWFERNVTGLQLTPEDCYKLRCALLHQGRARPTQGTYSRVLFTFPTANGCTFHDNVINDALNLDVVLFCETLVAAAEKWLDHVKDSPHFQRNLEKSMRLHPRGIAPYMIGMPIIG